MSADPHEGRLEWERDGRDWPNRAYSRLVSVGGLRWHVQRAGCGPELLLLHGTGAATHSWRVLLPLLARHFTVIAPDLPGHGFTAAPMPGGQSLTGMANAVAGLLDHLGCRPALAVGHSAGAAILVRMSLDRLIAPRALVSLNGALLPLPGLPGLVFPPLARVLSRFTAVPKLFARHAANGPLVRQLIADTGSTLDAQGQALYARLARSPAHVAGALGMMADWDLWQLERDLPRLLLPLLLVTGANDRTLRPGDAARISALVAHARTVRLPRLGHLAHEEQPRLAAALLLRAARSLRLLGPRAAPRAPGKLPVVPGAWH